MRLMIGSHEGSHHNVAPGMALGGPAESGEFLDISPRSGHPLGRFSKPAHLVDRGSEWRCVESSLSRELDMLALFKSDLTFACFKRGDEMPVIGFFLCSLKLL